MIAKIEVLSKEVIIDNERYEFGMSIHYGDYKIRKTSNTIDVDDEGEIKAGSHTSTVAESKSSFSVHGIDIPNGLFPKYIDSGTKTKLRWPFPMLIILDLGGNHDLNLNSARTEILYDNKWVEFEGNLFFIVCEKIAEKIGKKKWKILKEILIKNIKNDNLLSAISKV